MPEKRRRWMPLRTSAGQEPVRTEIEGLPLLAQVALEAAMRRYERCDELGREVKQVGHIDAGGQRWVLRELRLTSQGQEIRLLFVRLGAYDHVCLGLVVFSKKTKALPLPMRERAAGRLQLWLAERQNHRNP